MAHEDDVASVGTTGAMPVGMRDRGADDAKEAAAIETAE
jgi:hypothetical protein